MTASGGLPVISLVVRVRDNDASSQMLAVSKTLAASVLTEANVSSVESGRAKLHNVLSRELLAAGVGVYALFVGLVISVTGLASALLAIVRMRSKEIGVRMALGSSRVSIQALLARDCLTVVGAGLLIGIPVTIATLRVVSSQVFGAYAFPVPVIVMGGASLLIVTCAASALPALAASRVDPIAVLRED